MNSQIFDQAATDTSSTVRRPQDHGPLTAAEVAQRRQEHAIVKSYTDAYASMCRRHGPGGLK